MVDAPDEGVTEAPSGGGDSAIVAAANAYARTLPPPPTPPALDTPHQRGAWAMDIAEELVAVRDRWAERRPDGETVQIGECWVGAEDLAVYVRFDGRWGHRVQDLHLDVWLGGPAASVIEQASDIYHDLECGGPTAYVDECGFEWSGPEPEHRGWRWSIHEQPRLNAPLATASPLESACGVASTLTRLAAEALAAHPHDPVIEDCWVGEDLALYTRYRYNGELRGHRAGGLGRARLKPEFGLNARNLAKQIWLELGTANQPAYVDRRGCRWSGDDPEAPVTWAFVIEHMPRAASR